MFCHIFCQNFAPYTIHPTTPTNHPKIFPQGAPGGSNICCARDTTGSTSPRPCFIFALPEERLVNVARMEQAFMFLYTHPTHYSLQMCVLSFFCVQIHSDPRHFNSPQCSEALQQSTVFRGTSTVYSAPRHFNSLQGSTAAPQPPSRPQSVFFVVRCPQHHSPDLCPTAHQWCPITMTVSALAGPRHVRVRVAVEQPYIARGVHSNSPMFVS
jgi:hypothetical protein